MAESTVVACPNCGKKYKISADKLGRTFKCTGCETRFAAGAEPEPTPPPVVEQEQEQESSDTESSYQEQAAPPTTVDYSATGTGKPKTSGMAIASLIFGLLGCVPGSQLLAILFGFLGLKKINKGLAGGKGLAMTGIVLGVLGIVAYIAGIIFVYPVVMKTRRVALELVVDINMQQIYSGISQYQTANDMHFPPNLTEAWKAKPSLKGDVFVSPLSKDKAAADPSQLETGGHDSYTYIYPGPDATSIGANDVLLYEKWTDINGDEVGVLFGDGHTKSVKPAEAQMLIGATGKHPMIMLPGAPTNPILPPTLTPPTSAPSAQ